MAWDQRSRALPLRPHLKQWKVCSFRLAEKQRLVPRVEPCKGHGPRCWPPRLLAAWKPSSSRTAAIVMAARTAAKSMAGRGAAAA